ncbi:MAG: hypothetical protein HY881_22300 [Deltaproteobacteria bacterium]|nr:hypothetical protein [Deltaproteobacteria bacterium]
MKTHRVKVASYVLAMVSLMALLTNGSVSADQGQYESTEAGIQFNPFELPQNKVDASEQHVARQHYSDEVLKFKAFIQDNNNLPFEGRTIDADKDSAAQPFPIQPPKQAIGLTSGFEGIGYTHYIPPDPIIAAGPNHVLLMVNSSLSIYDKNGTSLLNSTLGDWFSSLNLDTNVIFDPKCVYDPWSNRYIVLAVSFNSKTQTSYYLIAVSQTSDATGNWWKWKLDATLNGNTAANNTADYPQIGYDSSQSGNIYITSNQFDAQNVFQYAKLRVLKKSQLYSGSALTWNDFWNLKNGDASLVQTLQPVHTQSTTVPEWFVCTVNPVFGSGISLFQLDPTASAPSLTLSGTVSTYTYIIPPNAKQKGGGMRIDTGDCRLLNAIYQNDKIYTTTVSAYNWGNANIESIIRYFKIDVPGKKCDIDAGYGNDLMYYYYPAICVDSLSNIYLIFNRSSSNEYASVYFTGQAASDTQLQPSTLLKAGQGNYIILDGLRNRWGDYNGIARDFSTDRVWIYGEYAASGNQWGTYVGNIKF